MMKPSRNQSIGKWGEKIAVDFLENDGFSILHQNYRTPFGEIDIIGTKEGVLVFFEVKTRTSVRYGYPEESITNKKRENLLESITYYVQEHAPESQEWQIDILSIERFSGKETPNVTWFKNAIQSN